MADLSGQLLLVSKLFLLMLLGSCFGKRRSSKKQGKRHFLG